MSLTPKKRHNGLWISVLYFAEGFPYTVVNVMSVIFFKGLGASNELIGLTSLLSFPWVFKGLWSPLIDLYFTKRKWILGAEIACTFLFMLLAFSAILPQSINIALVIFSMIAFVSATHDIAIDGFYLNTLTKEQQAFYVGVRNTAYRIAMLVGGGALVSLAGFLSEKYVINTAENGIKTYQNLDISLLGLKFNVHPLQYGWATSFGLGTIIFAGIYIFQRWYLPRHPNENTTNSAPELESKENLQPSENTLDFASETATKTDFFDSFITYFQQEKIFWVVGFVLLFRLGDALTFKMATPFLMDPLNKGGLAISTKEIGILSGTIGVIFLLLGGLLGGFIIAKQGLKKWIFPMAIMQNSTNLLYFLLSIYQPTLEWAYVVNSIEQFTYGLGVAAYTVFLMRTVRPEFQASHYAITTGFMAAGVLIPGIFSGYIQQKLGYPSYFLMGTLATIPGMITIFFLPWGKQEDALTMPRPGVDDND